MNWILVKPLDLGERLPRYVWGWTKFGAPHPGESEATQFSSLASPLDLCYQRHFLKRAFRKTGKTTK